VQTGSTENNFGVFQDFGIQVAAWTTLAADLQGLLLNPNGLSDLSYKQNKSNTTLGCYEMAYLPLSWFDPGYVVTPVAGPTGAGCYPS
jgi:hypothetical protein